jgi:beta-glucosidase
VQLYIHDPKSALPRPEKELKGWAKVELDVGETKNVEIEIGRLSVGYWDEGAAEEQDESGRWVAERGVFECWVGASAGDIRYVFPPLPFRKEERCFLLSSFSRWV